LSTGKTGVVYLQNSGLGNTINPLTSLTDPEVYRIPLLMIIGWRGEPGVKDEPQHVKQGRITAAQLELLEIPHWVLDADSDVESLLKEVFATLHRTNAPVALLVRKDTFSKYKSRRESVQASSLKREEALGHLLTLAGPDDLVVSTTGKTSREVYELRLRRGEAQRDFLTVGCMGHTASIALGVALGNPKRRVICLDGDGSMLMHLGALPIIGDLQPANLVHVLLNNAAHESVGGQPTVAGNVDFAALSKASGYRAYQVAANANELKSRWHQLTAQPGPVLLEVKISTGSREDLGRPAGAAEDNKRAFMEIASG
jgi:phosphonopyruvate decarboxylase